MPELPEVEVVKQSLEKYILNKKLLKIIVKNKNLRYPVPENISKKLANLKIHKIKIPQIKIVKEIGLKISKIEKPMFLIDINSLFDIKFLYKKAIDITTIKGIVSLITEGNLRIDR